VGPGRRGNGGEAREELAAGEADGDVATLGHLVTS